ncbi:MAG: purine-nucleoside phosphorylase [Kiritimatiellae bacterium]|nr:purine-nucleoside phosphorylase [Kiritimatiellia bacterium]
MATLQDVTSFEQAAASLPRAFFDPVPECGLVLGSGWSQAVKGWHTLERVSYRDIPGLGASTVAGHAGELLLCEHQGLRVAAFCGRRHWYEGAGWLPVTMPVELLRRMGVRRLLLTNAAGGVSPKLQPGDLLLIRDHVNTAGLNPLQGPVLPGWGERFPDQSRVYDAALSADVLRAAQRAQISVAEGIYAFTAGPAFETPAEIRAYGIWGVDAVGMSTVPEAMVANAMGMQVAAISCITNMAAGIGGSRPMHGEVLTVTAQVAPRMRRLLDEVLSGVER